MNYANFEGAITEKHGIVIENWPLKTFCSPSDVKSRNEVKVLLHAWESGTSRFRLMSAEEWEGWSKARFQQALNDTTGVADLENTSHPTPSSSDSVTPQASTPASTSLTPPGLPVPSPTDNTNQNTDSPLASSSLTPPGLPVPNPTHNNTDSTLHSSASSPSAPSSSPNPDNSTNERHRKKKRARVVNDNFMNTTAVSMASGTALVTSRKTRKTRSDKGVKRKRVDEES